RAFATGICAPPNSPSVAYSSSDLGRLDPIAVVRSKAAAFRKLRLRLGILAERKGFEPLRRFPVYTLSRRAPSTTRPPLRVAHVCWKRQKHTPRGRCERGAIYS